MNIIFLGLLAVKFGIGSTYTWTYRDWVNQVLKKWGNKPRRIGQADIKCETKTFMADSGVIYSPNHPLHYPNNANCKWVIEVPKRFTEIHLHLIKFNVENPKWSRICLKDYIEVFQYTDGKRERKGKYCGKKPGYNITIYGNKAEIVFKSNNHRTRKGFHIMWKAISGCGGDLRGNAGELRLPSVPLNDKRVYCEWRIATASIYNEIEIRISSLRFARNYTSCRRGYLSIYDGHKQEVGKYCDSTTPQVIRINGNKAIIKLRISRKTIINQFVAVWRSSKKDELSKFQCGVAMAEHHRHRRLVGGAPALRGTWPWIAQIRVLELNRNFRSRIVTCGGVIVSEWQILTAAHCLVRKFSVLKYEVLIGAVSEYNTERKLITFRANQITKHPQYNWTGSGKPVNDIALITLTTKMTFSYDIQPICLPDSKSEPSSDCEFAGWGKTGKSSRHSQYLNTVRATTWGHCGASPSILCATYHGENSGACKGDSGSPIICKRNGRKYLAGVLSFGATTCPSSVDGYSDVRYYLNWIHNVINMKKIPHNNS